MQSAEPARSRTFPYMVFSHWLLYSACGLAIVLDRISKHLVQTRMDLYQSIEVLGDFFRLTYIRNAGISFGMFSNSAFPLMRYILLFFTCAAVVFVITIYVKSKKTPLDQLSIGFILGGAVGNLFDRLFHATVIDFLDFGIGSHRFYVFNLADSAIFLGIVLLSIQLIKDENEKKAAQEKASTSAGEGN